MKSKVLNLLLLILIFITILSIVIIKPLGNLDEVWNYNFSRNIADGLIPYKDFNMVITPLLSIVCGIILKVVTNELMVMRILAALLCSVIIFITYKLFTILNIRQEFAIIFTFFIGYIFKDIFCIDYNYLSLLLVLLIIYIEIKNYKKDADFFKTNYKKDILLGILSGLAITTKQTSGLIISIVLLGNKLLFVNNKKEFKLYIKSFAFRIIGIIIPVFILILYLLINHAFLDFINYTILGVSEFTNIISYKNLVGFNLIGILSILVPITFLYEWFKTVILKKDRTIYFFTIYGLASLVTCFPISDVIHFSTGSLPILIILIYEVYELIKKIEFKALKFILHTLSCIIIVFLFFYASKNFYNYFYKTECFSKFKHYTYIPININYEKQIRKICNYIKNNENTIILDASAASYMIPLNRYNKDYDMLNKGNLGKNGEERLINDVATNKDRTYLILKDKYIRNWQTPENLINYVLKNKVKVGEILTFDIYK